ncbi:MULTISPECIES: hypothetical protein [unclassified Shinella]|uniref:hypothetical protein n=1 Tax=unclassified Shinella TaxID=2643062 RepID=UPI00234F301B|nr:MULTISPECIES: hypothetical protein [unclassified Shinella]MCO5154079.1 hypothetical protein [Shinella sp.]MDC7267000.1 hypothetical protein [Shinella sp. HY16]MDC7273897.1 hypothetical protein [Shinella sp. YZ44]
MFFKPEQGFRDYIRIAQINVTESVAKPSPLLEGAERFCDFFQKDLLTGEQELAPTAAFLLMHSFTLYESSVATAMTGHAVAIYPLLRTALESACYAYLMKADTAVEALWLNRHDSEADMKAARKAFTSAVKDVAAAIDKAEPNTGKADLINLAYQGAIDWGAHPNPRSIYHHMEEPEDIGTHIQINLTALHPRGALEYDRSLLACLDFGMLLGIVIAHTLSAVSTETMRKLQALNDMKEALLESEFPDTYAAMGPLKG